jgi:hypothetical protein
MSGKKRMFSMGSLPAIALTVSLLSLISSGFQSWNYARNIESVQRNVLRAENLRTCKDIIEVFFQLRLKAEEANRTTAGAPLEMKSLAYRFGALGTFLANFRDDAVRLRYTQLSWELLRIANEAAVMAEPSVVRAQP